jgi:hypothetical protein
MAKKSSFPAWGFLALGIGNLGAGILFLILISQGNNETITTVKSGLYALVGLMFIFFWIRARKNG